MKSKKALLKIWYRCNYSCNFCHAEYKKEIIDIPLKALLLKIILLKKRWVETILLSGGESSLEKHFFEIISFIKKQDLDFGIVTNGSTICSEAFLNKLDTLWIKNIYVSLHWYWDVHNKIVWDTKSYDKVTRVIWFLQHRSHIALFLNYVVVQENLDSIHKTLESLIALWVGRISIKFSMLEPEGIGDDEGLVVDLESASRVIKEAIDKFSHSLNIYWDGYPLCFFDWYLDKRADLKTENIQYITEVYEHKIFETDYGNREYTSHCKSCDLQTECYGIFGKYKKYFTEDQLVNLKYLWKK